MAYYPVRQFLAVLTILPLRQQMQLAARAVTVIHSCSRVRADRLHLIHPNFIQRLVQSVSRWLILIMMATSILLPVLTPVSLYRSEERRVGKECRSRWS